MNSIISFILGLLIGFLMRYIKFGDVLKDVQAMGHSLQSNNAKEVNQNGNKGNK